MNPTYESDRVKVWKDEDSYSCSYRTKKFLFPGKWQVCGSGFLSEGVALDHACHMWFISHYFPKKKATTRVVESGNNWIAQRKVLGLFWKNISGKVHERITNAYSEINSYEGNVSVMKAITSMERIIEKRTSSNDNL